LKVEASRLVMSYPKCKAANVTALVLDWWHHPLSYMEEFREDIYSRIFWTCPV